MGIEAELARYRADVLYLEKHRQELLAQYPEHWVAIYHQQLVGAAKDPRCLLNQLKRKGIPPSQVHRERLSTKDDLLIVLAASA